MAQQKETTPNDNKEDHTQSDNMSMKSMAASLNANFKKMGNPRNTKKLLIEKDIIKKPGMENAETLQRQIKTDKLKKNLQNKSADKQQELEEAGIIKHANLPNTLVATAHSLEAALKSDALKQGLNKRSEQEDLHKMGILQNKGVANALQPVAKDLEKAQKKDVLSGHIQSKSGTVSKDDADNDNNDAETNETSAK